MRNSRNGEKISHNNEIGAKDKKHREALGSENAQINKLEVDVKKAEKETADLGKDMARIQAGLQAAESQLQNTEKALKDTKAELEAANAEAECRIQHANEASEAADEQRHELQRIEAENKELVDACRSLEDAINAGNVERLKLEEELYRAQFEGNVWRRRSQSEGPIAWIAAERSNAEQDHDNKATEKATTLDGELATVTEAKKLAAAVANDEQESEAEKSDTDEMDEGDDAEINDSVMLDQMSPQAETKKKNKNGRQRAGKMGQTRKQLVAVTEQLEDLNARKQVLVAELRKQKAASGSPRFQ